MLNYIWAGLIIFSLLFALVTDVKELVENRFRNDVPLPVTLVFPEGYDADARRQPLRVRIDPAVYQRFYDLETAPDSLSFTGVLVQTEKGQQVRFGRGMDPPPPLGLIQEFHADEEGAPLRTRALGDRFRLISPERAAAGLLFNTVRFRKLRDIAAAALDFAETAAALALSFIGVLALFLGLLKIGEEGGLIHSLTKVVQPILRPLFPGIPDGHPALAMISLNMLANVFGLGNAATPLGLKAMEELQTLNPSEDTATNAMVTFLAINTASVQLVPPVLLLAILGLQVNQLIFSIILATGIGTLTAIAAAFLYGKLPRFRKTDPQRQAGLADDTP